MQMSHSESASDLLPAQFMKKQPTLCNFQYFCLSYLIKAESLQLFLVLFQIYFMWKLSHFPTCADPAVLYYLGLFASICECFTAQQRNRQLNGILNTEYFRKYLPPFTLLSCRFILMDKENLWMLFPSGLFITVHLSAVFLLTCSFFIPCLLVHFYVGRLSFLMSELWIQSLFTAAKCSDKLQKGINPVKVISTPQTAI